MEKKLKREEDAPPKDPLIIDGRSYRSRLIIGTGKYKDYAQNAKALEASGAQIITVAVRRVNLSDPKKPRLTDFINPDKVMFLPNSAGCYNAQEAVRLLRLAREAGGWSLVKLEVIGDKKTLYPDMVETIRATEILVKDGFSVMVYCSDDIIVAKRLEDMGACAVMPLAAPIGSGRGIQNAINIRLMVESATIPVLVDAGIGTASDAAMAMELGCDGVIVNSAIALAQDPERMARAMRYGVAAGRLSYRAGRMKQQFYADPSSPLEGMI